MNTRIAVAAGLAAALLSSHASGTSQVTVKSVETTAPLPLSAETGVPRGVLPLPEGAVVVNFDDLGPRPCVASATLAFRDELVSEGVRFRGVPLASPHGGGVFDQCSNFGVTGYSPPNFMGFNREAIFADGGIERLPERIIFTSTVSSVQINAGSGFGTTGAVLLIAFDSDGTPLGFDTIRVRATMQSLSVSAPGIKRITITGNLSDGTLVLDDLAFIPE